MEIDWQGMQSFGEAFGVEWLAIILLLASLFAVLIVFIRQIKGLSSSVDLLSTKIDPHLDTKQSLVFFRAVMNEDILKKLRYLGDLLRANSIQERKKQIEINISREFKRITTEEATKLSDIKSVCGDMGKIYQDKLKWDKILNGLYAIFFSSDADRSKIKDIRLLLESSVDAIAGILEENGVRN